MQLKKFSLFSQLTSLLKVTLKNIESLKKLKFCETYATLFNQLLIFSEFNAIPSIAICPLVGCRIPRIKSTKVVLPDPDSPPMPTMLFALIIKFIFSKTLLVEFGYLYSKLFIFISDLKFNFLLDFV